MSAALVGGGAVAGAAVGGPVGAAVGALVGWLVGQGLAPSSSAQQTQKSDPEPSRGGFIVPSDRCGSGWTFDSSGKCVPMVTESKMPGVNVASQSECPDGTVFQSYTRQPDSRGDCRPPAPSCPDPKTAVWTLTFSPDRKWGMGWECRDPALAYTTGGTSGLSGSCGPGTTLNPLPVGPQCLPTSESAYTSAGPNRSPFAGAIAGPRVSR